MSSFVDDDTRQGRRLRQVRGPLIIRDDGGPHEKRRRDYDTCEAYAERRVLAALETPRNEL